LKILIDFGEPMPDHKLVARLLQYEHTGPSFAIFTDRDYKKAVGIIVRELFEGAVRAQQDRDAGKAPHADRPADDRSVAAGVVCRCDEEVTFCPAHGRIDAERKGGAP
jgi:hypothetical protein